MTGGPPPAGDHDLVRRFRQGDHEAFAELMRRHERRVYNLAYRMLGRAEDARDATQEAFVSCFRHLGAFRGESAFSTWLHRIAVNACYDILRRRGPVASLDGQPPEPAPAPDHADRAAAAADVQRALLAIPPEFRAVLVMFEVQDMSLEDIAAALDIPVGTVKSRLHRGRVALGRALGHAGHPGPAPHRQAARAGEGTRPAPPVGAPAGSPGPSGEVPAGSPGPSGEVPAGSPGPSGEPADPPPPSNRPNP